jgi:hypothetical protein
LMTCPAKPDLQGEALRPGSGSRLRMKVFDFRLVRLRQRDQFCCSSLPEPGSRVRARSEGVGPSEHAVRLRDPAPAMDGVGRRERRAGISSGSDDHCQLPRRARRGRSKFIVDTKAPAITRTLRGNRNTLPRLPRQAEPIRGLDGLEILAAADASPLGRRDAALLALDYRPTAAENTRSAVAALTA